MDTKNETRFMFTPGEDLMSIGSMLGIKKPESAPPRKEGDGPFHTLVLQNAMVIDGTGAPTGGPYNVIIVNDRIDSIVTSVLPLPPNVDKVIDCSGKYVMPGFVNSHLHMGTTDQGLTGPLTPPEYVLKLNLAHGITAVRDMGALVGLDITLDQAKKSEANEITAPRIFAYPSPYVPTLNPQVKTAEQARAWVASVAEKGITGIKLFNHYPEVMAAIYDECKKRGLRSACHHTVSFTSRVNALDSARMGGTSMEHFLGLAEVLSEDGERQNYREDYCYDDELKRAYQDARMWRPVKPGSQRWNDVLAEMKDLDYTIVPTLGCWEPGIDYMRYINNVWHKEYTWPALWRFFLPNPSFHWSFYHNWTTKHEIEMKHAYVKWMAFLNDYRKIGGRVVAGCDAGFAMRLYGFDFIRELELLQEAGFTPLEVVKAATLDGAVLLGQEKEFGSIDVGKKADLQIIDENPLENFKTLYGTGHLRYSKTAGGQTGHLRVSEELGKLESVHALRYVIKDGIIYDPQELLGQVREMVAKEKEREASLKE